MNILPLVSAFILIFAIGSYTFVHNFLSSVQEREHFYGSMKISHTYARKLQAKKYRAIKAENLHKKKPSEGEKKEKPYKSPRLAEYPRKAAKLNIRSLIGAENPKLAKVFLDLVCDLYALSPLDGERLGERLLNLMKQAKHMDSLLDLITLAPEEEREEIYKMLKGTQVFAIGENTGYPALTDYVKIGKESKKPISFPNACKPVLDALFGHHITPLIIAEEGRKWEPKHEHEHLTKAELEPILLSRDFNFSSVEDLVDFSTSKEPIEEEVIEESKIKIRYKV